MGQTIGVISLGCAKNQVDTERMLGLLLSRGFTLVTEPEKADILIVNTCGFIDPAKQESIESLLEMAKYKQLGSCKKLVATGCLTERYRKELAESMPELDVILGVREYDKLPALLGAEPGAPVCCGSPRVLVTPPYTAYLRIADGCDNRCAYCAIPLIRGPLVSEPVGPLLEEAKRLASNGVTELTVIAQDTSGYGRDRYGHSMLPTLLAGLDDIESLRWIRLLYTYPDTVTPELIDLIKNSAHIVPYLDMPIQHISDPVLKRMRRRGDSAHIKAVLEHIRKNAPEFTLRTTVMVGFPGETEDDFSELMQFLQEYPFDRLGAFVFSPEEGTPAADMPDQVPEEVAAARYNALMAQQQIISHQRAMSRIGQVTEVLVEDMDEDGVYGRTRAEAPDVDGRIILPKLPGMQIGQYRSVCLTGALPYDMTAEWV